MNRALLMFSRAIEAKMDGMSPATQDAIDRIVAAEGFRGRSGMLEVLRGGAHYRASDFCSALLSAWKDKDLRLATGKSRDEWLHLLDASSDQLSADRSAANQAGNQYGRK